MSGWEVVPDPWDIRGPQMVGIGFSFYKRNHTECAELSEAGDLGTRGAGQPIFLLE